MSYIPSYGVKHSNIKLQMFLDDLDGTAHRRYGKPLYMTWTVGRGGFIHYKPDCSNSADVEDAMSHALDFQENRIAQ